MASIRCCKWIICVCVCFFPFERISYWRCTFNIFIWDKISHWWFSQLEVIPYVPYKQNAFSIVSIPQMPSSDCIVSSCIVQLMAYSQPKKNLFILNINTHSLKSLKLHSKLNFHWKLAKIDAVNRCTLCVIFSRSNENESENKQQRAFRKKKKSKNTCKWAYKETYSHMLHYLWSIVARADVYIYHGNDLIGDAGLDKRQIHMWIQYFIHFIPIYHNFSVVYAHNRTICFVL